MHDGLPSAERFCRADGLVYCHSIMVCCVICWLTGGSASGARPSPRLTGCKEPDEDKGPHIADAGGHLRHLRVVMATAVFSASEAVVRRSRQHFSGRTRRGEALRSASSAVARRRQQLRQPVHLLLLQCCVSPRLSPDGATAHLLPFASHAHTGAELGTFIADKPRIFRVGWSRVRGMVPYFLKI